MKIFLYIFRSYMLHKIHVSMNIDPVNRTSLDISIFRMYQETCVLFIDTQTYNIS